MKIKVVWTEIVKQLKRQSEQRRNAGRKEGFAAFAVLIYSDIPSYIRVLYER